MTAQGDNGFVSARLTETVTELEAVREMFHSTKERLAEAEAYLRFYADPRSYEVSRGLDSTGVFQDRLKKDYSLSDNDPNTYVAGMRAREYFKPNGS